MAKSRKGRKIKELKSLIDDLMEALEDIREHTFCRETPDGMPIPSSDREKKGSWAYIQERAASSLRKAEEKRKGKP